MSIRLSIFPAFLSLLLLSGCCAATFRANRYMKPGAPSLDLNKEIEQRCVETFSASLSEGCHLSVMSSKNIHYSGQRLVDAYEKILPAVTKLSQKSIHKIQFRLYVIDFDTEPQNYSFDGRGTSAMLVILEGPLKPDETDTIICELEAFAPHEWFHAAVGKSLPAFKRENRVCGGWYEEGLACYCAYLCDFNFPWCAKKDGHSDEAMARAAFLNDPMRAQLWTKFAPGCEVVGNEKTMKKMTEAEIKAFWKPIDEGYDASLGAFIFLEKKLGKDRLLTVVHALQGRHDYQDDAFYRDLAAQVGFDIRVVSAEEISAVFRTAPYGT